MPWSPVWNAPRPYVHPVVTPAGARLTTEAPADHPWHHALWFAIKLVNGENFWEEYGEFGLLETRDVVEDDDGACARDDRLGAARRRDPRPDRDPTPHAGRPRRRPVRDRLGRGARPRRRHHVRPHAVHDLGWVRRPHRARRARLARHAARAARREPPRSAARRARRVVRAARSPRRVRTEPTTSAGSCSSTIPTNPRFPTPWYGSNRAETYGEGWANFLNAAFLWDGADRAVAAGVPFAATASRGRLRRSARPRSHRGDGRRLDVRAVTAAELAARLRDLAVGTVEALEQHHLPGWRIPRVFAGHAVAADVRADLCFTLGHLADAGVEHVAGAPIDAVTRRLLARRRRELDAHVLLVPDRRDAGPARTRSRATRCSTGSTPRSSTRSRARPTARTGSSCSTPSLLPRNYAAVLARCELGRERLGLATDPTRARRAGRPAPRRCSARTRGTTSTTPTTASAGTTSTPPTSGCSASRSRPRSGRSGPRASRTALDLVLAVGSARRRPRSRGAGRPACSAPR